MISLKLQLILIAGAILSSVLLINSIRKYRLELKYTMLWLALMFIILVLSIFPNLIGMLSNYMGIELPVNALFLFVSFCALLILFSITVIVSRSSTRIKELSQEIGLLKLEMKRLKSEIEKQVVEK